MVIVLDLDEIALGLEIGDDRLAAFVAVHAVILAAVDDVRVLVHDQDLLEVVAQTDLIVVRVVAGRHLDGAGAEAELDVIVRHDGQLAAHERQDGVFADEVLIALVVRMDGDAGVAQHGLGTGGGDDELLIAVLDRIADVPEVAGHVLVFDLGVREGRAAVRAPVDDAVALIDQALFIELAERLAHGLGAALVHREAGAGPVAARAERLLLLDDAVAVLVLPVPDAVEELVAAEIIAREALGVAQVLLHLDLRGDAGVVIAGQPQGAVALHALIAREHVLQRGVERVAHVELAGDVRGRHGDAEGLLVGVHLGAEIAALFPHVVDFLFDLFGVIHFRKFFHVCLLLRLSSFGTKKRPETNLFQGDHKPRYHLNSVLKSAALLPLYREDPSRSTAGSSGLLRGDFLLRHSKGSHQPPSL